jgi:hypothetical protein
LRLGINRRPLPRLGQANSLTRFREYESFNLRVYEEARLGAQPADFRPQLGQPSGPPGVKQFPKRSGNGQSQLPGRLTSALFVHEQDVRTLL